jgi:serine protease Do
MRRLVPLRNLPLLWLVASTLMWAPAAEGAPRWGWLGVRIRDLSEAEMEEISQKHGIREGFGALIVEVLKETPAAASGLRTGDLVVAVADRPVVDTRALQRYVGAAPIGETVSLTVLRRDEGRRRLAVRVGLMPEPVAAERVAAELGFLVREPEPRGETGEPRPPGAPAVAAVLPRSRAEQAGLRVGDVLVEVNGRAVATLEAVREALLSLDRGPLALVVSREGQRVPVLLRGAETP